MHICISVTALVLSFGCQSYTEAPPWIKSTLCPIRSMSLVSLTKSLWMLNSSLRIPIVEIKFGSLAITACNMSPQHFAGDF